MDMNKESNLDGLESFQEEEEDGGLILLIFPVGVDQSTIVAAVLGSVDSDIVELLADVLNKSAGSLLEGIKTRGFVGSHLFENRLDIALEVVLPILLVI